MNPELEERTEEQRLKTIQAIDDDRKEAQMAYCEDLYDRVLEKENQKLAEEVLWIVDLIDASSRVQDDPYRTFKALACCVGMGLCAWGVVSGIICIL